jgi:hypothetical protein
MLSEPGSGAFIELYECFDVIKQSVQTPRGEAVFSVRCGCHDRKFLSSPLRSAMTFTESILRVCSAVEKPLFLSFACWDFDVMLAKDFY